MKAAIVVGACFGDEGKGLMVDFLARPEMLVVRFNGGAQAGHTVVDPDGWRHVFHHFGSGARRGAATYLSEFFVVNPFLWQKELDNVDFFTTTYVHPDAPLTTPFDMFLNQQRARQGTSHGSCGCGIHETLVRGKTEYATWYRDVCMRERLHKHLRAIRGVYLPRRLAALGLPIGLPDYIRADTLVDNFLAACHRMRDLCRLGGDEVVRRYRHVVFEGAQGLLLDEGHEFFPHVTPSRTGVANAATIAGRVGMEFDVIYVARSYMTRHGAGPFPSEDPALAFADDTNRENEFQGPLRFGALDVPLVSAAVRKDRQGIAGQAVLAMTHLDQHGSPDTADELAAACGIQAQFFSSGPTRRDVVVPCLAKV